MPHKTFQSDETTLILAAFEEAYRTLFGRTIAGLATEITNWSIIVSTVLPEVAQAEQYRGGALGSAMRTRQFFDAAERRVVEAQEVARETLTPGVEVSGPAVVVERETTTIVTSRYKVIGQGDGSLLLTRKGESS